MARTQSQSTLLATQMEYLIERGRAQGKRVTYVAIAAAIDESAQNVRKLHLGLNINPGFRTLAGIARYFDVPVTYFACHSPAECAAFLAAIDNTAQAQAHLEKGERLGSRLQTLSPQSLEVAETFVERLLQLERKPSRRSKAGASAVESVPDGEPR